MSALPIRNHETTLRHAIEQEMESDGLELPLLPSGAMQIIELCQSPDSSAASLSTAVHRDPALAAHVLRVANSTAYAGSSQVVSLQQAIGRLGQRTIVEIVVAVSVKGAVFDLPEFRAELESLWRHAAAAGAWAREIARHRRRSVDAALLCGLLQNVGMPVLLKSLAGLGRQLGGIPKEDLWSLAEEYHPAAGSRLARLWGLPDQVAEAILYHHDFETAPTRGDETRMVALADSLATHLLGGTIETPEAGEHPSTADLNLYPDDLAAILAKAPDVMRFVETMK